MTNLWVVNSSPLILLGKIGYLWLLPRLATQLLVPEGVAEEVSERPEGAKLVEELLGEDGVTLAGAVLVPTEIGVWDLGLGETEVLAHCVAANSARAVLDDLKARRCASAFGLSVVGTLGVVLRAKQEGVIPEARSVVQELLEVGLYAPREMVDKALAHLGE